MRNRLPPSGAGATALTFDADGVAAHLRLCHSRMPFVRAYPRESQEMVFDGHDRAFAFFKGTCTRGMPDYVTGHIIGLLCRSALCGQRLSYRSIMPRGGAVWPHIVQSEASQSSRAVSSRHTGLRGNAAEVVVGGAQARSAASFERMLMSA